MRDFLRGTMGCALQIVLFVAGCFLIAYGADRDSDVARNLMIVLGILCFCAVGGIRYWLGNIFRIR
jgi:hypothetical protein